MVSVQPCVLELNCTNWWPTLIAGFAAHHCQALHMLAMMSTLVKKLPSCWILVPHHISTLKTNVQYTVTLVRSVLGFCSSSGLAQSMTTQS